jgi:NAD(P)H-nitrite reductase large subunit
MIIDRCYCYRKTFAELKEVAEVTGSSSIAELQSHIDFGLSCHLCHPYVNEMLKTGEVEFDHIIEENPFHKTSP